MRRVLLALVVLLCASSAFSAPSAQDLHLRARLLLKEIRAQAASPQKDTKRLRAELSALKAENSAAPDDKVSARLRQAEDSLALVDAGTPLPPPTPEEAISDEDLRDAIAQPTPAPAIPIRRAPSLQGAGPAALPETAAPAFDGSIRHAGLTTPSVEVPADAPDAPLDDLLNLDDPAGQSKFLSDAAAGLLEKLKESDKDGSRALYFGERLRVAISNHPKRGEFISLRIRVTDDKRLHLIYRAKNGGAVDEDLGFLTEWATLPGTGKGGGGGRRRKKPGKKGGGGGGGGDDGEGGSSSGGHKHHGGHKSHGGGGGGGGGDDGGDGGGAGPGGSGASHHAKAPHAKGGAGMFDGGGDAGDSVSEGGISASGGGRRGRGGHGRGRKGGASSSAGGGEDDGGGEGSGAAGSGRAHVSAGRSISGDNDDAASGSGSRRRGASVPLPKDFTTRGGGSRLDGEDGGGRGSKGADLGPRMGTLGHKDAKHDVPPPPVASRVSGASLPNGNAMGAAPGSAVAAASAAPQLKVPFMAEQDLHDAVAANAAVAPRPALSRVSMGDAAPVAPEEPASSPLTAAFATAALAAGAGLGAYAFRRSRKA